MDALSSQGEAGNVVQTCPKVTLEIGVFFDGTGNNEMNAQVGQGRGEGSYSNALTNVSLLKDLYYPGGKWYDVKNSCGGYKTRYARLYVQGIGTDEGEEDDFWGSAMGVSERGVENRVIRAALEVGNMINRLSPGVEPEEVILDVFGFSRGAAAARHFVNGFNAGRLDYTRWGLFNDVHAKLPEGRKVTLRFVGIFDTVAAIVGGLTADNWDVNVHLKSSSAETIHHITAKDEIRESFALNRNTPGGGDHEELAGVHSDIGGGYHKDFKEEPVVVTPATGISTTYAQAQTAQAATVTRLRASALADAAVFISEGWINTGDVPTAWDVQPDTIESVYVPGGMFSGGQTYYSHKVVTRMKRPWMRHELSRLALRSMHKKAEAAGVAIDAMPTTGNYEIPAALERASGTTLKRNFTHYSSNYNDVYPVIGSPMREAPGRRRITHANDASKAK